MVITPDGKTSYAANAGANTVSVISTTSNNVTGTITVGATPRGLAMSSDEKTIYVSNLTPNSISVIDVATNTVVKPSASRVWLYVAVNSGQLAVIAVA